MAPPVPRPAPAAQSAITRAGFAVLLVWTFLYFSRFLDITFKYLGGSVKVMMPLNALWLIAALFSGGIPALVNRRASLAFTAFVAWIAFCVPFSYWIGGSLPTLNTAFKSLLLMAAVISLASTTRACTQLMFAIGFGLSLAGLSSAFAGQAEHGRLSLNAGTFSDSNFYCLALVMGMPFVLLKIAAEKAAWKKFLLALALAPMLLAAAKTGSRAGFLALCGMLGIYLLRSGARQRVYLIAGAMAAILFVSTFASDYVLKRYTTIFSAEYDENLTAEENQKLSGAAVGSAKGRLHMFFRSIELTLEHPLVGVGPGLFARAEGTDAEAQGMGSTWHETHNSYTQASSETGIPGLILYAAGIILTFRSVGRVINMKTNVPGFDRVRQSAIFLQLSMITFVIGATFLSIAYAGLFFYLAGLAVALERAAEREFRPVPAAGPLSPILQRRDPRRRVATSSIRSSRPGSAVGVNLAPGAAFPK
jgi:O-antigen ligase